MFLSLLYSIFYKYISKQAYLLTLQVRRRRRSGNSSMDYDNKTPSVISCRAASTFLSVVQKKTLKKYQEKILKSSTTMMNLMIRRLSRPLTRMIPFSTKVIPRAEPLVSSSLESIRIVKFDQSKEIHDVIALNYNMDVLSLREMLPYLSTHRNSTMVIHVPVQLTLSDQFRKFVHDLVLLTRWEYVSF